MRIINVITVVNNTVSSIVSFGVYEEQLSSDVVKHAEEYFTEAAKEYGWDPNTFDEDDLKDDGYYEFDNGSISLVWSDTD